MPTRLLAALAAAAAVAAADPPPPHALRPDPKAGAAPAAFAGVWVAEQPSPAGDVTRSHEFRVIDADTAVWSFTQVGPGYRQTITTRGRYAFAGGEFRLHPDERYAGEEKLPPRPADTEPRVYRFAWDGPEKAAFTLVAPDAAADSPWRTAAFRKGTAAAAAADPLTPRALHAIDRTLVKEPRYDGTPLYLLLAFGPDSTDRVWAVLDGVVLYLDKNGNGDLTEDGERFFPQVIPGFPADRRSAVFRVADLSTPTGKHTDFMLSVLRVATGGAYAKVGVRVNGTTPQLAGPTDLRLTERPADARVLPFGSRVVTAQVSHTMRAVPEVGKEVDFRVRVGTPGVGPGSFVAFGTDDVPEGVNPVAEFAFAPTAAGGEPRRLTVPLTERCCGDHFYAAVTAPDGTRPGVDAAGLVIRFPNCPWGPLAPVSTRVDVAPKGR